MPINRTSSLRPMMNDEELIVNAIAVRMLTDSPGSIDKASTMVHTYGGFGRSTVEGYLRKVKPGATDSEIEFLLDKIARRARDKARAMRADIDRETSESAVARNDSTAKTSKMSARRHPLSFSEFVWAIYDFVDRNRLLVFVVCPLIVSLCSLLLFVYLNGSWPKTFEEFGSCFALPFGFSVGIYCCFFTETGNHAAKGNEGAFGCLLIVLLAPVLGFAYFIYRFCLLVLRICSKSKMRCQKNLGTATIETRINRLKELQDAGIISTSDYDAQLARLIGER